MLGIWFYSTYNCYSQWSQHEFGNRYDTFKTVHICCSSFFLNLVQITYTLTTKFVLRLYWSGTKYLRCGREVSLLLFRLVASALSNYKWVSCQWFASCIIGKWSKAEALDFVEILFTRLYIQNRLFPFW